MKPRAKTSEQKSRRIDIILWIIRLLAIVPATAAAIIYFKTFVPIGYLLVFGLVSGLLLGFSTYKMIKAYSNQDLKNHIFFCVWVFGGLLTYALLWINYNYPRQEIKTYDSRIIEIEMSNRGRSSVLTIEFAGIVKEIHMPIEDYDRLKQQGYVTITVDKGLFGAYIIIDKKL